MTIKNTIAILLLWGTFLSGEQLSAQAGFDITVKIKNYHNDTIWFGHTYGRRAVPVLPAVKQPDGTFHLQSDEPTEEGLYAIVYKDRSNNNTFLSCWLVDGQRQFTIETELFHPYTAANVQGSNETRLLWRYIGRYNQLSDTLDESTNNWKVFRDESSYRAMVKAQESLRSFQEDFMRQYDGTRTAELIRQTCFLTPDPHPEAYENWQAEDAARHLWMRRHYFDKMDIGNGSFLKYPLWVERTDYYFSKLPPPEPDSMTAMIEEVLHRLEPDTEAYQYYFGYIMNSISRMSRHRTDEVFVHFVREYVDKGRADFLDQERKSRYKDDADRMEPLFAGNKAPDATFIDRQGKAVSVYGVQAPYTLLVFWLHDCGHCKKELPIVSKLYESWKNKGLKVISVCGKSGDEDTPKCWEFADNAGMPSEWHVVSDPQRRTRFASLFNVRSYPRIILLDAEKRILFKQSGSMPEDVLKAELERTMK